ncbi:hypothetical protein Psi02_54780 [Planotetraspora silvatica]|uniref:Uncharacterized protein n=1 Tax=Planotetraspora silvatica TaxID=234614 RepID=A0A8J3XQ42_9ACTN|nr:hypothetical protein Psi02_54780 [Planotetraspora silvatica]
MQGREADLRLRFDARDPHHPGAARLPHGVVKERRLPDPRRPPEYEDAAGTFTGGREQTLQLREFLLTTQEQGCLDQVGCSWTDVRSFRRIRLRGRTSLPSGGAQAVSEG